MCQDSRMIWSVGTNFFTLQSLTKKRMGTNMSSTLELTSEGANGSLNELPPWEIAIMSIIRRGTELIDVEHATDSEFFQFVDRNGIPLKNRLDAWSFDDRCGVINHARRHGVTLQIVEVNNSEERAVNRL